MNTILLITQGVIAFIIVILILMQQRGTALGSAFGGGGSETYSTRRGIQKKLLYATVVLVIAFLGLSLANLMY